MRQAQLIFPLMNRPLKMLRILQIKDTFPFSRTREAVPFRSYIIEVPVPASRSIDQLQSSWPMKLQRARSTCHNRVQSVEDPRTAWVKESERERDAGFTYQPVRPNRWGLVPVYRTGLAGNRFKPVEVKFEFKILCANGSYRYTGRFDRFTGRFDW